MQRDKDYTLLKQLGPFIQLLCKVTLSGEYGKNANDKIKTGEQLGGVKWNLSGAFLLWRGFPMKPDWIADHERNVLIEEWLFHQLRAHLHPIIALGFALDFDFVN